MLLHGGPLKIRLRAQGSRRKVQGSKFKVASCELRVASYRTNYAFGMILERRRKSREIGLRMFFIPPWTGLKLRPPVPSSRGG